MVISSWLLRSVPSNHYMIWKHSSSQNTVFAVPCVMLGGSYQKCQVVLKTLVFCNQKLTSAQKLLNADRCVYGPVTAAIKHPVVLKTLAVYNCSKPYLKLVHIYWMLIAASCAQWQLSIVYPVVLKTLVVCNRSNTSWNSLTYSCMLIAASSAQWQLSANPVVLKTLVVNNWSITYSKLVKI